MYDKVVEIYAKNCGDLVGQLFWLVPHHLPYAIKKAMPELLLKLIVTV